jgi:hypothetical protein
MQKSIQWVKQLTLGAALSSNAQSKRRQSTADAQGPNKGHENAEGMAFVGVRLIDQLGAARY